MNYSELSTNQQRVEIAANGYRVCVTPDCYDMRKAIECSDIARSAHRASDPAKSILRFAVFLKACKMAGLEPNHLLEWLSREWGGKQAIADFARSELGMVSGKVGR